MVRAKDGMLGGVAAIRGLTYVVEMGWDFTQGRKLQTFSFQGRGAFYAGPACTGKRLSRGSWGRRAKKIVIFSFYERYSSEMTRPIIVFGPLSSRATCPLSFDSLEREGFASNLTILRGAAEAVASGG